MTTSRPFYIALVAVVAVIWWTLSLPRLGRPRHQISGIDLGLQFPQLNFSSTTSHQNDAHFKYYASQAARELCSAHGYSVFSPRSVTGERKIYDLSMVNTELDFLEIRLNTLYDYVDYFILVESPKSFQRKPKAPNDQGELGQIRAIPRQDDIPRARIPGRI